MKKLRTSRRRFLKFAAGASVATSTAFLNTATRADGAEKPGGVAVSLGDDRILIAFDSQMRSRVWHAHPAATAKEGKIALTRWAASDTLAVGPGAPLDRFALREQSKQNIDGPLGRGIQLRLVGVAAAQIEKTVRVELLEAYPGFAFYRVSYRNVSTHPVTIDSWTQATLHLSNESARAGHAATSEPPFWSFCGSTHADHRD